jgi:hypothetical protein
MRSLVLVLTLVVCSAAMGQQPPTSAKSDSFLLRSGSNEWGVWGGFSAKPITAFSGITVAEAKGRKFGIVGVNYARTLAANRSAVLQYTLDAIPIAVATNDITGSPTAPINVASRATAYGFGLVPLGLRLNLNNSSKVKPFIAIGAGGMLFNKPVPLPDAGKFAFVLEGGGGVRWFRSSGRAVWFGAKLHHLSNGNRSGSNRGLNQLVFFTGFSVVK